MQRMKQTGTLQYPQIHCQTRFPYFGQGSGAHCNAIPLAVTAARATSGNGPNQKDNKYNAFPRQVLSRPAGASRFFRSRSSSPASAELRAVTRARSAARRTWGPSCKPGSAVASALDTVCKHDIEHLVGATRILGGVPSSARQVLPSSLTPTKTLSRFMDQKGLHS